MNGSLSVSPAVTTIYTLTATGPGGATSATATVDVATPIDIVVLSPVSGDTINRPDVLVRGTFTNSSGAETGISVNGVPALVFGNEFCANHVPLAQGANTITVAAVDSAGHKAVQSLGVPAEPAGQFCTVVSVPEASLAPYAGELIIAAPSEIQSATMLVYGPGAAACDLDGAGPYPLTIFGPGLYRLAVEVTTEDSNSFTDETAVLVYDAGQLDALLQAKWNAMKACLGAGDVPGALKDFDPGNKPIFEYSLNLLQDHLGEVVAGMKNITLVKATETQAEYNLVGEQNGQEYSFYLVFEKDGRGIWRLNFF